MDITLFTSSHAISVHVSMFWFISQAIRAIALSTLIRFGKARESTSKIEALRERLLSEACKDRLGDGGAQNAMGLQPEETFVAPRAVDFDPSNLRQRTSMSKLSEIVLIAHMQLVAQDCLGCSAS